MSDSNLVSPVQALLAVAPDFFSTLSETELLAILNSPDLWIRPDQSNMIRDPEWSYYGFVGGRGYGKTHAIATEINRRVEHGQARHIGLMAPTEIRVDQVQFQNLIDTAPVWFTPERHRGELVWPNEVHAIPFTPEAPGRPRSENLELSWLCEIVDWQPNTQMEAFNNITTATRVGRAQVIWDTTSRGKNRVIQHLMKLNRENPSLYPITRGAMFDNYMLSARYLQTEASKYSGREYDEEVLGLVFGEAGGALFHQAWLDTHRVHVEPRFALKLVSVDPGLSEHKDADETGIIVGGRDHSHHSFITADLSGKYSPEAWGDIVVQQCKVGGCAGAIVERNHLGDHPVYVIRSRAANEKMSVRVLAKDEPFPSRQPNVIAIREHVAGSSKSHRAGGPAAESESGRLHMVGTHPELELQLTTWIPGQKSPNRLDAMVYAVLELAGLDSDRVAPARQARAARKVQTDLRERLRSLGRGRVVGR